MQYEGDSIPFVYNLPIAKTAFTPASTFKIPNALIALETGTLRDTTQHLVGDGIVREVSIWNQDHSLNTAFRNSVVWYFQEVARRIGPPQMQTWITCIGYGNQDISGEIDRFWLDGALKISAMEQVRFIQKLFRRELPCSVRSQEIVVGLMEQERPSGYVFGGKTGWCKGEDVMVGWFVGYLANAYDMVYFANCIQTSDTSLPDFGPARRETTRLILQYRS